MPLKMLFLEASKLVSTKTLVLKHYYCRQGKLRRIGSTACKGQAGSQPTQTNPKSLLRPLLGSEIPRSELKKPYPLVLGPGDFRIQNLAVSVHQIGLFELGPGDFGIQNLAVSVHQIGLFELGPGDFGIQNLAVSVHQGIGLFELGPGDFGIQNLAVSVHQGIGLRELGPGDFGSSDLGISDPGTLRPGDLRTWGTLPY